MTARRLAAGIVVGLMSALALGCDAEQPGSDPPIPRIFDIPTMSADECAGVGGSGILHGDADDPEIVWVGPFVGIGERQHVIWPTGYRARFDPALTILDEHDVAVLREGDFIDGHCVTGGGPGLLMPPFQAFRLECGPMPIQDCVGFEYQAGEQANAETHPIDVLRFTDATGRYQVRYEDGTIADGAIKVR